MRYYIGPWQWIAGGDIPQFAPPVGAIGAIDLGTVAEMSTAGTQRKGCLCWTDGTLLSSDYDLLGVGDIREINRTAKLTATIRKASGATPKGDRLHEMILDCFVDGSDPDGNTGPKPIVPGGDGWIDLWLPGHGRVKGERFEWGRSKHTDKLKRQLRAEFSQLMDEAEGKKLRDREHHRRCLDALCEKYGVDEWREFVPAARQKDVPGRLKHETTITESFNTADSSTLGPDLSWTEIEGNLEVFSNACRSVGTGAGGAWNVGRANSDLSSVDHYSQATNKTASGTYTVGTIARKDSTSTLTYYLLYIDSNTSQWLTLKRIAGTYTSIGSTTSAAPATNDVMKLECNGSSIRRFKNGSSQNTVTDTAISSGLRCGVGSFYNNASYGAKGIIDDFSASDLTASGILYTQLERGTRGVERGVYTCWGR